jgi:peptidoglycan/LPS O-acetylase OafA/YrhL
MGTMTSPQRRVDGIDCLRALAIVYVLMNHIGLRLLFAHVPFLRQMPPWLGTALIWQGQAGVQIFFAVSGYLITSTSINRWGIASNLNIVEFYELRVARIVPLLFTLLAVLSVLHLLGYPDYHVSAKVGGLPAALFAALTLRVGWFEATRGYFPGNWDILWSLSVEELFYLAFPLLARLLRRNLLLLALLAVFIVLGPFARTVFAGSNETWQEYTYLGGMDAIAMGCLTAMLTARCRFSSTTLRVMGSAGFAIMVFCLGFSKIAVQLGLNRTGLSFTLLGAAACLVIVSSAQSGWRAPRWMHVPLALGRRSYEIYLTHMFVVFGCFHAFVALGKPMQLVPIFFILAILLALALGEIVGRWFSEPVNHWLRRRFGCGVKGCCRDWRRRSVNVRLTVTEQSA